MDNPMLENTPRVDPKVVEYLERIFPNKLPSVTPPSERMSELIGQQQVIAKLRAIVNEQDINILETR